LGKPYTITVSHVIYAGLGEKGYVLNQGDQLRLDFNLKEQSNTLSAIEVNATGSLNNTIRNLGAATAVTARDLTRLPVNGRNFTSLIDLSPLSNGNQLSGQIATSTNFFIDGMTSRGPLSGGTTNRGPYSVSMEAIREFEIATNQHDVTYGRAGGGTISTATKSGTNTFTGSVFTYGRTNWLASPYDIRGNQIDQEYSTYQFGFSLGGPIVKDKAHFFVALDQQSDSRPFYIADIRTPEDESRLNINQSTLDEFMGIANGFYSVWDIRASKTFHLFNTHAIEVSADIFNFANLLNKEWGVNKSLGKQNLTTIRGFDQDSKEYTYQVNPNAGVSNLSGNPYQIQLGVRYSF